MKNDDTITVNGQAYDTRTGLPVDGTHQPTPPPLRSEATSLHAKTQKSVTLRRSATKKPAPVKKNETLSPMVARRPQRRSLDIARHPRVTKTAAPATPTAADTPDIAPRTHPYVEKANQRIQEKKAPRHFEHQAPSSKEVKEAEIERVLSEPTPAKTKPPKKHRSHRRKKMTRLGLIIASCVIVAGVIIWLSLPMISIKLASAQTGVSADIPHYTPEGFSLKLPIDTKDSKVAMTFSARHDDTSFVLTQSKSSWNSEAVRAMVETDSEGRFLTTRDRGLTVYTYNGNAAWVNKGILYMITGNADLSNDAIMRIANSL